MESQPEELTAEQVRDRIRREHYQIAEHLARVEQLSEEVVGTRDPEKIIALREALQVLGAALFDHLHFEEYRLPSLAEGDGDIEAAAEVMRREHQAQRELLHRVIGELDETAVGGALVVGVRELAHAIRDDMEHEEREILSKI